MVMNANRDRVKMNPPSFLLPIRHKAYKLLMLIQNLEKMHNHVLINALCIFEGNCYRLVATPYISEVESLYVWLCVCVSFFTRFSIFAS